MAKDIVILSSVWFRSPLVMLPLGGTHISTGPRGAWKGWTLRLCRLTQEVLIVPPRDVTKCGLLRVPMSNVLCFQISSATKLDDAA